MPQLVVPKPLNPLDDVAQMLGIKQGAQNLQIQQQEIQKNQAQAATAAMNADQQKQLQSIFSNPASFDPQTGVPTKEALIAAGRIHPQTAAELMSAYQIDPKSLSTIANQKSEMDLRTLQGQNLNNDNARADQQLQELIRANKAKENAPHEVSQGAAMVGPDGQVIYQAPPKPSVNNLQHVPIVDPTNPNKAILANYDDQKGVYTDQAGKVIANARPVPPMATMGDTAGLTPEAKLMLAQQLLATGQIPNVGMGASGSKLRTEIVNQAAAGQQSTPNLAASGATFKADAGSLASLQKNRDAVVSFENTANKNLDNFLNSAKGIVDSGSPWINAPLRTIDQKGLGSKDLAAFNAARQVAINEIAKVTSNPGLTGQLSDSARHEVEAFIPANATLAQIYSVANILKTDMKNRHDSLDAQIGEIKGRLNPGTEPAKKSDPLGIR